MSVDRRKFLKLAGLSTVLGLAGQGALAAFGKPLSPTRFASPLTAKRWAMVIDMRKWTAEDSVACVEACRRAHNVPEFEDAKHAVKWIWMDQYDHAFPGEEAQYLPAELHEAQIPLLCNHCDNPPCTRVCPTQATWKRESDGIVMMDWHRCIGCRFCMAACPYGSRSFNWGDPRPHIKGELNHEYPTRERGVVEKCTFCEERLAEGEEPACVAACKSGAMTFGDLEDPDSEVRRLLEENFTIRRKPELGTHPEIYYIV